jgi:hypothetical protein
MTASLKKLAGFNSVLEEDDTQPKPHDFQNIYLCSNSNSKVGSSKEPNEKPGKLNKRERKRIRKAKENVDTNMVKPKPKMKLNQRKKRFG